MSTTAYIVPELGADELDTTTCEICSAVRVRQYPLEFTYGRLIDLQDDGTRSHAFQFTYNYTAMLKWAGIWLPREWHGLNARNVALNVLFGLVKLVDNKQEAETFNPPNGWGSYDMLVPRLCDVVKVGSTHPEYIMECS